MFETTELAIIHKAVSEMAIKGADAHAIVKILDKIVNAHRDIETSAKSKKSGK